MQLNEQLANALHESNLDELMEYLDYYMKAGHIFLALAINEGKIKIYFSDNSICCLEYMSELNGRLLIKTTLSDHHDVEDTIAKRFNTLMDKFCSDYEKDTDDLADAKKNINATIAFSKKYKIIKTFRHMGQSLFIEFADGSSIYNLMGIQRLYILPDCPLDLRDADQLTDFIRTQAIGATQNA